MFSPWNYALPMCSFNSCWNGREITQIMFWSKKSSLLIYSILNFLLETIGDIFWRQRCPITCIGNDYVSTFRIREGTLYRDRKQHMRDLEVWKCLTYQRSWRKNTLADSKSEIEHTRQWGYRDTWALHLPGSFIPPVDSVCNCLKRASFIIM